MNKLIFNLFLILFLFSCSTEKISSEIIQLTSDDPIFLRINERNKEVVCINVPLKFVFKNNSGEEKLSFSSISHKDFDSSSMSSTLLYEVIIDSLVKVRKDKYKIIDPGESKTYIFYTQHNLNAFQSNKLDYLVKGKTNSKIMIDDVKRFKKEQKTLLDNLINKDSVYIRIKEADKIRLLKRSIKV